MSRSSFLELPTEIRLQIFKHLFVQTKVAYYLSKPTNATTKPQLQLPLPTRDRLHCDQHHHAILQTCKQIRQEALEIYYQNATFTFIGNRDEMFTGHRDEIDELDWEALESQCGSYATNNSLRFASAIAHVETRSFGYFEFEFVPRFPRAESVEVWHFHSNPLIFLVDSRITSEPQIWQDFVDLRRARLKLQDLVNHFRFQGRLIGPEEPEEEKVVTRAILLRISLSTIFSHPQMKMKFYHLNESIHHIIDALGYGRNLSNGYCVKVDYRGLTSSDVILSEADNEGIVTNVSIP